MIPLFFFLYPIIFLMGIQISVDQFFPFSTLKISFYPLWATIISSEKSSIIWSTFSLLHTFVFAAFKTCCLYFAFNNFETIYLWVICMCVFCLVFILYLLYTDFYVIKLEEMLAIVSTNYWWKIISFISFFTA